MRNENFQEENFTDFQKEFGFKESMEILKKKSEIKENRLVFTFNISGVIIFSACCIFLFFFFDRDSSEKMKKSYLIHSTNMKLTCKIKIIIIN